MESAMGLQSDGGLEPFVVVSPKTLRRVPEGAGRLEVAWVEPTATAPRAIRLAGSVAGKKVLVTGGGPIGQLVLPVGLTLGGGAKLQTPPIRAFGASEAGAIGSMHPTQRDVGYAAATARGTLIEGSG